MSHLELLESELQNFRIELPQKQRLALAAYCDELVRWNKKINLTALSGVGLVRRLVAEPVWIAFRLGLGGSLADIGSGNGSPAIPFQIVTSLRTCRLIEARGKRAAFLRHLTATLKVPNVSVHRSRVEDIAGILERPDWISLQGVTLSEELMDSIRRFAGPTTTIVWITSPGAKGGVKPLRTITVPVTNTQVSVFQLDLF